jgi:hypothetical protein
MNNTDISELTAIAKCIAESGLQVNGSITGRNDDYELVSYIDEIVVLDSLGQEVVAIPNDRSYED